MQNSTHKKLICETIMHQGVFYAEKRQQQERRQFRPKQVLFERRHKRDKRSSLIKSINICV
ncbi:hypothetical protein NFHSH190041_29070 [Shewanella sp. NFH-SH190041]|nr:hypothetical protein NFHSH190041_29070 [Shewanella sp. NFH-SH190041]